MTVSIKSKFDFEDFGQVKIDGHFYNFEQVKTMLFPLTLILHEKNVKNFLIIIYISCEIDSYFKTSSIKTNKNYITPFLKKLKNQLNKSHGKDFLGLPSSPIKTASDQYFSTDSGTGVFL